MKQRIFNISVATISIIALIFSIIGTKHFGITNETYISIIVSTLGIATTLAIGFQIYNVIEIKEELKQSKKLMQQQNIKYNKFSKEKTALENKFSEEKTVLENKLLIQESLLRGSIGIINANFERNNNNRHISFYITHNSLIHYLKTDLKDLDFIFYNMREDIVKFDIYKFTLGGLLHVDQDKRIIDTIVKQKIDTYIDLIKSDENTIREQTNFDIIRTEYNRVMEHFYNRLYALIQDPNKNLSDDERNKILNPS